MNESDRIEKATKLYLDYLTANYDAKINLGNLLEESGQILFDFIAKDSNRNIILQRHYLLKKISDDLMSQARDMAYTKKYDSSPKVADYIYLAFKLAFEYYNKKPSRFLLPILKQVLYYEKFKKDNTDLEFYSKLYNESIIKEKEYLELILKV